MNKLSSLFLIRRDERARVFYFCLLFLLIGAGMAIGRSTADALFFKRYGIQYLPIMYGVLSVVFMVTSIGYAAVADRFAAERVFKWLFISLLASVTASWLLISFTQWETAYPIYFIVYEIASELLLLHGALYISQNFETLQSKRLSPLMFGSAQIGTITGGLFVAGATLAVNIQNVLLVWCAIMIVSVLVIQRYHARKGNSPFYHRHTVSRGALSTSVQEIKQGLHFTRKSALLRASSYALFFMVVAFFIMCFSLNRIYTSTFPTEAALGRFFGLLTAVTSALALIIQFFVTGRMLHRFGVKKLNMIFPTGGILTYLALLATFSFPAALMGSFVREVLMPAVRRPTRNLFFNALPDYIQGRARAVSVSLVLPLALAVASGVLVAFRESVSTFLIIGFSASLAYLYFALRMNKEYVSELVGKLRDQLFVPDKGLEAMLRKGSEEILQELERGISHDDDALAFGYAKLLLSSDGERFKTAILPRLQRATAGYQDKMIRLLATFDTGAAAAYCRAHAADVKDVQLKATMLKMLIDAGDKSTINGLEDLLADDDPRLVALGILGVHKFDIGRLSGTALQRWRDMFNDSDGGKIAALELLGSIPEQKFYPELLEGLRSSETRRQLSALQVLQHWSQEHPVEQLEPALATAMGSLSAEVRGMAVRCYHLLPDNMADQLYLRALEDSHVDVRETAIEAMDDGTDEFKIMLCSWVIGNAGSPRAQKAILTYLGQCQIPEPVLWEIVVAKTDDAFEITEILRSLDVLPAENGDMEKWKLLKLTLEERKKQILNLVLQVLERVECQVDIRMIYAGVNSKDSRNFANAVEALSHITNKNVARKLIGIFEGTVAGNKDGQAVKSSIGFKEILGWCAGRPDPWLRECVAYVKSKLGPGIAAHV